MARPKKGNRKNRTLTRRKGRAGPRTLKRGGVILNTGRQILSGETAEQRHERLLREKPDALFLSERQDTMDKVHNAIIQRMKHKCLTTVETNELKKLMDKSKKYLQSKDRNFVRTLQDLHQTIVYTDEAILKDVLSKKAPCGGVYEAIPKKSDLDDTIERRIIKENVRLDPNFDPSEYLLRVSRDPDLTQKRVENREVLRQYKKVLINKGHDKPETPSAISTGDSTNRRPPLPPREQAKYDAQYALKQRQSDKIRKLYADKMKNLESQLIELRSGETTELEQQKRAGIARKKKEQLILQEMENLKKNLESQFAKLGKSKED